jgi:hypothetical protein
MLMELECGVTLNNLEQEIVEQRANKYGQELSIQLVSDQLLKCKILGTYPYHVLSDDFSHPVRSYSHKIKTKVSLNTFETSVIKFIGPKRTAAARKAGLQNYLKADRRREGEMEINGIGGELAYGKQFNLYPSEVFSVRARSIKEDNGDFEHYGNRVDVKTTEHIDIGHLTLALWKVPENKKEYWSKIHFLTLMTGNYYLAEAHYYFCGYLSSKDMCRNKRRGYLPNTDEAQYLAEQDELTETMCPYYETEFRLW